MVSKVVRSSKLVSSPMLPFNKLNFDMRCKECSSQLKNLIREPSRGLLG